ncbi:MAG: hypothetical protein KGI50_03335 [Patescibacteria group bacterium]|nr:hypothetical protein [Patescibacteria group bacterium]MDE2438324.1 hypothetical protein [Patescibacteria group bacterium]
MEGPAIKKKEQLSRPLDDVTQRHVTELVKPSFSFPKPRKNEGPEIGPMTDEERSRLAAKREEEKNLRAKILETAGGRKFPGIEEKKPEKFVIPPTDKNTGEKETVVTPKKNFWGFMKDLFYKERIVKDTENIKKNKEALRQVDEWKRLQKEIERMRARLREGRGMLNDAEEQVLRGDIIDLEEEQNKITEALKKGGFNPRVEYPADYNK